MKILIPGGHLTPALGFIDFVKKYHPEVEFVFVGRRYSQTKLQQMAIEEQEVKKRSVTFVELESARLSGNIFSFLSAAFGFLKALFRSFQIIKIEKPTVLLSFGGYLAVPLVISAKILKVPIVAHEGTTVVGKANSLIFKLADRIAYSFPNLTNFKISSVNDKAQLTGTPLREVIINEDKVTQPRWFSGKENDPIILVLGGNQGSLAINQLIKQSLRFLVTDWTVVHQCGRPNKLYHYKQELEDYAIKEKIDSNKYFVHEWIEENDLLWLYKNSFVAIARAGANTLEELMYHQVPSILIPLPYSNFNEQLTNAKYLEERGASVVLNQEEASVSTLMSCLSIVREQREIIRKNISLINRPNPQQAASKIYDLVMTVSNND